MTTSLPSPEARVDVAFAGEKPWERRRRVRESLKEMISDGRAPFGSRLLQHELAKQLGTSVNVVREVLLELSATGLVESVENLGFFVCKQDVKKISEAYELRALHDGWAARLCCGQAGRNDIRDLREMAEGVYAAASRTSELTIEDLEEVGNLNRRLHARMVEIAGNETLKRVRETYWVPTVSVLGRTNPRAEDTYREHMAIIEAIEQDRGDDAERLTREHVFNSLRCVAERMEDASAELTWGLV